MCPCDRSRGYVCESCERWIEAKSRLLETLRDCATRQINLNIGEAVL